MENAHYFRSKLASGKPVLGNCITFIDPTVTEALTRVLDFVWIDTEHNPMSLERVQGHIMATKGTETVPLVRVHAAHDLRAPLDGVGGWPSNARRRTGADAEPARSSLA